MMGETGANHVPAFCSELGAKTNQTYFTFITMFIKVNSTRVAVVERGSV